MSEVKEKILILGCGISGLGAARLAEHLGYLPVFVDAMDTPRLRMNAETASKSKEHIFAWKTGTPLPRCRLAVISPGIPTGSAMAEAARAAGANVTGELEFACRNLKCPIAAITGTNGKTTTTELTTALLNAAGFKAMAAGNIGISLSDAALDAMTRAKPDILVVETSSFQLESVNTFKPSVAAFLNLASDHVNRHGSMEAYAAAKFKIFDNMQRLHDNVIVNSLIRPLYMNRYHGSLPTMFSADAPAADFNLCDGYLCYKKRRLVNTARLVLSGKHNLENALAALAVLRGVAGEDAVVSEKVLHTLRNFRSGAHRIERFAEKKGVKYINDSKATNPHSVNAALKALGSRNNVILILGGLDKGMDFSSILEDADKIKSAFLCGECAEKIYDSLSGDIFCTKCGTFDDAVEKACAAAESGDIVALSPACASMDMFANYAERGEHFKEKVFEILSRD